MATKPCFCDRLQHIFTLTIFNLLDAITCLQPNRVSLHYVALSLVQRETLSPSATESLVSILLACVLSAVYVFTMAKASLLY